MEASNDEDEQLKSCFEIISKSEDSIHVCQALTSAKTLLLQRNRRSKHCSSFLELLLSKLSVGWIHLIPKSSIRSLFDVFFLEGPEEDVFMTLCSTLSNANLGFKANKCASLLEECLESHQLQNIIRSRTICGNTSKPVYVKDLETQLVTYIGTLPERVSNKLKLETSEFFFPQQYITFVCQEIISVLEDVSSALKKNTSCSLSFVGQIIGKLCLCGHSENVWTTMLPIMTEKMAEDVIWCRVCETLICNIPERSIEVVIVSLLQHVEWYENLCKFLGHSVLNNHKLQYLLTSKLLFVRYFTKNHVLYNLIGYLSHSPTLQPQFHKVIIQLLDVWGDGSSLKHRAQEQHLYITKALLICSAYMKDRDCQKLKDDILGKLLHGVQCHLGSSVPSVRTMGMIVAETFTRKVDPKGHKLEFEYERTADVEELLSLTVLPVKPKNADIVKAINNISLENRSKPAEQRPERKLSVCCDSDLDSDDDLEPMDMSHDVKVTKTKPPVYVRECMEGLISSEDFDKVEVCLNNAEKLIRRNHAVIKEIAVEFAKILVHLQDNFNLPLFTLNRTKALVALTVTSPKEVAEYLGTEFYERNYNVRQRLDMLEVLATSAKELASPAQTKTTAPGITEYIAEDTNDENNTSHWKDVVAKRIESKTRRFAHGRQQPQIEATANRFGPVAANFFYPLLRGFNRNPCLDLLGEDHIVLARLVFTLAIIINSTQNTQNTQMCKEMFQLTWSLRYHPQSAVRRGLLFALSMTILAVPPFTLLADLLNEVQDTQSWLQDVVTKEADTECRELAIQALVLIENSFKQMMKQSESPG